MSPRVTATATATVELVDRAARRGLRPLLYVAAVIGLVVAVLVHDGTSPRALVVWGLCAVILLALGAITALVVLVLYSHAGDDPAPIGLPQWAFLTPGVEVTDHRRVVGRSACAACGVPAVRVIRGPSGLNLPVCGIHMSAAADYLRALPGGPR